MTDLERLEQRAADEGLHIDYIRFDSNRIKGLYCDGSIAISSDLDTSTEKLVVLSEEIGHHYTSSGDLIEQVKNGDQKQERKARLWAYNNRIGLEGIIKGYVKNCQNRHELAELLGVTEAFLQEALECYREKYGEYIEVGDYTVMFEPTLAVIKRYE